MLTSLPAGEVLAPADPVRYRAPRHPALQRVVSTFWMTAVPVSARIVRVLPDAAVDLVVTGGRLGIAGPDTRPCVERLPAGSVLGVQLRPEAVAAVLGMPASELVNARVDLEEVWGPPGRDLGEQVREARSGRQVVDLLERALVRRTLAESISPIIGSLRAQLAAGHRLDVRRIGWSERQLRRRCVAAYGYGPSLLTRVMRFQGVADLMRAPASGSLAEIAVVAGYVDQSHLAHDVGEFSGLTPAALRRTLSRQEVGLEP